MRYVAAYCLAALGGGSPSTKDIEKILSSVGVDCDADEAKKVVGELEGKNLEELIAEGMSKLGSMPAGGGGGSGAAAAGGGGAAAAGGAAAEEKEEKTEEPEEESDDDMGFGLFD
ncbi:LOW QUALITY PROTEIN: large ribosomal subunit protein P2-like [Macrobrachium nipponense]|uniref:LOW QUALITY PROTEIN: large ribosomal subunit protein P2-like n=1 Tax=Macrobrachium nipponense TaxID=159736 RepID=UPI0030C8226B